MLSEDEIARVGRHGSVHDMGMCSCPCYAALVRVGEALKTENELRVKLAKASPEALAALTIGATYTDEEEAEMAANEQRDQSRSASL